MATYGVTTVGVEGTSSYGAGLTRHLRTQKYSVVEVLRPTRAVRRRDGKSDPVDAVAAARQVLTGEALSIPKDTSGPVESLRGLQITRRQLVMTAAKLALPVLECIDFVSDVGGVDQAPQYVVVEVAEAEGYAA